MLPRAAIAHVLIEPGRPLTAQEGKPHTFGVQDILVSLLRAQGWRIPATANLGAFEKGPDVLAEREGQLPIVAMKGYASQTYAHGKKKGQPKPTSPAQRAKHWFANAILTAIVRRTDFPHAWVALELPDVGRYPPTDGRWNGSVSGRLASPVGWKKCCPLPRARSRVSKGSLLPTCAR